MEIGSALALLRENDHAVAQKTAGWVTTIDNILCVLLFRDLSRSHRAHLVGELTFSMVLEGTKTTNLELFEDSTLLSAIKQSVISSFVGIPEDVVAEQNRFEDYDVVLRAKKMEHNQFCACCCSANAALCTKRMAPCCDSLPLVRLTFGVQCRSSVVALIFLFFLSGSTSIGALGFTENI